MQRKSERERLCEYIEQIASEMGLELVEFGIKSTRSPLIEVFVDKADTGVSTGECGRMNRAIRSFIEREGLLKGAFTVEVSSPGLDREIKSKREFMWAKGKEIVANLHDPIDGKSVVSGKLVEKTGEGKIVIDTDNDRLIEIECSATAKIRLKAKTQLEEKR